MIQRREFLKAGAAAAAAAVLEPSRLLAAVARNTPPFPDLSTWAGVRAQFNLSPDQLHFGSFLLVSHPKPVRDAIEGYRRAIDAEPGLVVERRMFGAPPDNIQLKMREEMCGYLGAQPDEIAITGNTTTGLALVYSGLRLAPGDEILTSVHDHYSHHESIRFAAEKTGASVRRVALYKDAAKITRAEVAEALRAEIRRETRVVGLTWVHSSTGVRLPITALAQVVADANATRPEAERMLFVVDGAHGFGAVDESVSALGCDFFCAGTHKWMMAPRGTGLVWAKATNWLRLRPTIPSFSNQEAYDAWLAGNTGPRPTTALDVTPGGFHAYEHQWAMTAAFRFQEAIGRARVARRIAELNTRLKRGLAAIPRVRVITPLDASLSAGITCFEVAGQTPEQVIAKLLERGIVGSPSPYLPSYARLAPSILNTPGEVDRALAEVKKLAAA